MPDLATIKKSLDKAGAAYKGFLERESEDKFFTKKQRIERKRAFLESHVDLFDRYFYRVNDNYKAMSDLSDYSMLLARDVASLFPDSRTALSINEGVNNIDENNYGKLDIIKPKKQNIIQDKSRNIIQDKSRNIIQNKSRNIIQDEDENEIRNDDLNVARLDIREDLPRKKRGEIDLQGQVFRNYGKRTEQKAVTSETVYEGEEQETELQKGLQENVTPAQQTAIREVCAWMYQNTKKHQKFVEGIVGRSLREKLLIFYIVENEKRHNVTQPDIFLSQQYIPNVTNFEKKLRYVKHFYKFGFTNINWDIIADAAATAFQVKNQLSAIGLVNEKKPKRSYGFEVIGEVEEEKEDNSRSISNDNLLEISTGAHNEEDQKEEAQQDKGGKEDRPKLTEEEIDKKATNMMIDIKISSLSIIKSQKAVLKIKDKSEIKKANAETEEKLADLENKIERLRTFAKENSALKGVDLEKEAKHPEGPKGIEGWNVESQKRAKYWVVVQALCNWDTSALGTAKKIWGDASWIKGASHGHLIGGMALDGPLALSHALAMIVNSMNFVKSFKSGAWEDITGKGVNSLLSLANASKSGFAATREGASLFAKADWGTAGTSATANTMKTATGIAGIAIGSVSAGMGLFNYFTGNYRDKLSREVADYLDGKENRNIITEELLNEEQKKEEPLDEAEKEEAEKREGKKQIIQNIVSANRGAAERTKGAAALQMIQGGMNVASGSLALASGPSLGVTGVLSVVLGLGAVILGGINVRKQGKHKDKEINDIIDHYINMDSLYANYLEKNMKGLGEKQKKKKIEKAGGEDKLKKKIREEVAGVLGFPSIQKLYAYILWQYSQALYDAVFKKNGRFITRDEWDNNQLADIYERKKYARIIRSLGFKLTIPRDGKEPTPGAAAIHKKLMA